MSESGTGIFRPLRYRREAANGTDKWIADAVGRGTDSVN